MNESLLVCEIFKSIQGESTFAGRVCSFIRLSGCNLECSYCDSGYARSGGLLMPIDAIIEKTDEFATGLVEVTGGEPLLQQGTALLVRKLCARYQTVLVETNGSMDIAVLPKACVRIVDVKCPSSGMHHSFLERNVAALQQGDEVKFVIGTREDFDYAMAFIDRHILRNRVTLLFSPVTGILPPAELAQWIIDEDAPVRLQLQLHKIIWGERRGV